MRSGSRRRGGLVRLRLRSPHTLQAALRDEPCRGERVRIGQREPLEALDDVIGEDAESRLELRPASNRRSQKPIGTAAGRPGDRLPGNTLSGLDQLALASARRKPPPGSMIHPVRPDRHTMPTELA